MGGRVVDNLSQAVEGTPDAGVAVVDGAPLNVSAALRIVYPEDADGVRYPVVYSDAP